MSLSLDQSTEVCSLLADTSRLRLLLLLENYELSVAELTEVTGLAQSRVSTHLARLRRAGLVQDKRSGNAALYSMVAADSETANLWSLLRGRLDDSQIRVDRERAEQVIAERKHGQTWAESVAGRMELHYSPGRTWQSLALGTAALLRLGDVLDVGSGDGAAAAVLAPHCRTLTAVAIGPDYQCHACGREFGAGLVRVRRVGGVEPHRDGRGVPAVRALGATGVAAVPAGPGAPLWAIQPPPQMLLQGPLTDLGERFARLYAQTRRGEMMEICSYVPALDYDWYLTTS